MSRSTTESDSLVPPEISEMRTRYQRRREQTLLDAASATISLDSILASDSIQFDAINPQMREAFQLAFPLASLEERLSNLDMSETASVEGLMSNWRGKYFEVIVRDELNSGGQVGDLVLAEGQSAVLASNPAQPGWDLQIVGDTGEAVSEIQLKATNNVGYVKDALEKHPDIQVLATDEVADQFVDSAVMSSGIENAELADDLESPLDAILDSPLVDGIEAIGAGLPLLLIIGTEGAMWLAGSQSLATATSRLVDRAVKTGVAMSAGLVTAMMGAGVLAAPATMLTRIGMARHDVHRRLSERVRANTETVRHIGKSRAIARAD